MATTTQGTTQPGPDTPGEPRPTATQVQQPAEAATSGTGDWSEKTAQASTTPQGGAAARQPDAAVAKPETTPPVLQSQQPAQQPRGHSLLLASQHPVDPTFFGQIAGTDGQPYTSLRKRVVRAYQWHTLQYWSVAFLSNFLLFLQILVAASLTALGGFDSHRARTATIFLGATNTVIAGLLTYFKSRNQPNRARQFRDDLQKVVDQFDDAEANFRNPEYHGDVYTTMEQIRKQYNDARTDAQANYPDLWAKVSSPYNPFFTQRGPTVPATGAAHGAANGAAPSPVPQSPHVPTAGPSSANPSGAPP